MRGYMESEDNTAALRAALFDSNNSTKRMLRRMTRSRTTAIAAERHALKMFIQAKSAAAREEEAAVKMVDTGFMSSSRIAVFKTCETLSEALAALKAEE